MTKKKSISPLGVIVIVLSTGYRPFQQALRGSLGGGGKAIGCFHILVEREVETDRDRQRQSVQWKR